MSWQPIATAPTDGTAILAYCQHDADPYIVDNAGRFLTEYGCACEEWAHVEDGVHVVYRVHEENEGDWESGYYTIPGYWAADGSEGEVAANPTCWMPLPAPPEPGV